MVIGDESNTNHRNTMKLDLSDAPNAALETPKETYRPIPEYPLVENNHLKQNYEEGLNGIGAVKNSNMVRETNDHIEDGAGDAMLAPSEKEQLAQTNEVKFISAEHKNGDAKIDIGELEKSFTGMTKEELMRYANDPFWVRLRWIFFILFWALWLAMLVGAVYIIIGAPKCAAPTPLAWYKQGPLVKIDSPIIYADKLRQLKAVGAKGVVYKLPEGETYKVHTPETKTQIKQLVDSLSNDNIHVIVDVTPNYVHLQDELFTRLELEVPGALEAFVHNDGPSVPNNWLSTKGGSAWQQMKGNKFLLSQFGKDNFDVQLNSSAAKEKFKNVLNELVQLGVKGVRLNNFEHYIVGSDLKDDVVNVNAAPGTVHTDYSYYTHTQTTYQPGLRDLIAEFSDLVKNATGGTGFVSVPNQIVNIEDFKSNGELTVELPVSGTLTRTLASAYTPKTVEQLFNELSQVVNNLGNKSWVQWQYDTAELEKGSVGLSEYNFFLMLLPGVPVVDNVDQLVINSPAINSTEPSLISQLEAIRESPSYMHGSFDVFINANKSVIAYARIKSGNPGYFVVYNPSDELVNADFTDAKGIPEQLTVNLFSKNYNVEKIEKKMKVPSSGIPLSARSAVILTYVPKSA